jgi:hypothetical protein
MHMQRLAIYLSAFMLLLAKFAASASADAQAVELLTQARAAIGGEKQVSKVQGLSLAGSLQRVIGDRQVDGDVSIDIQLPDKMLRTDSISPMGDSALIVTTQGVSGDTLLRSSRILNTPPGAMIRVPPAPPAGSDAEAQALRGTRADFARLTVALLLTAPASMPLEFAYGGEAESPDGKADVVDVKGPGSFTARLFLDKASHRPLMLTYRGVAPRVFMQRITPGSADVRGGRGAHEADTPPAPDVVDITLFLDDYRPVDGVMLPHHITRSIGGEVNEELTFKTVKVNPAFKPDSFR